MSKKLKWAIAVAVLFVAAVLFVVAVSQRQYRNVLMEMIIFPEGPAWIGSPVYRFVVQNDGTFISYTGICIHTNAANPNTIMLPFVRRRARITLSDEDFHGISEMVSLASETYATAQSSVFGLWQVTILHDGNVYERQIIELHKVADELVRLSPLMTQWRDPRIPANP